MKAIWYKSFIAYNAVMMLIYVILGKQIQVIFFGFLLIATILLWRTK